MKDKLFKLLDVEVSERYNVILLFFLSFFLGVFYATLDVGATTLFLDTFGSEMLPKAFLVSGIAGIVLTALYSKLQSLITFSKLAVFNLVTIALFTVMMRFGFELVESKWLPFIVFVLMGPLNLIAILGFSGMEIRLFSLRQGKRLFGIVESGQIFGMIIIGFAIPFILNIIGDTKNLLLICSSSIGFALLVQLVLSKNYKNKEQEVSLESIPAMSDQTGYRILFTNKFVKLTSLFIALSMIALFVISYSFLAVTEAQYPNNNEMAGFLGVFTAALMIFGFVVKSFVYSKLMKNYGLKVTLMILPVIIGIFTMISIGAGHVFGYTVESSGFVLFFLVICLSRLFSVALKEAIQNPSVKILYQSLNEKIRFDVQAKIDGVVNEVAASSAGVILAGLGFISFFELIHFSYFLLFVVLAWSLVTMMLYKEYRSSIQVSLEEAKRTENQKDSEEEINTKKVITSQIPSDFIIEYLELKKKYEPITYEEELKEIILGSSIDLKNYAHKSAVDLELIEIIDYQFLDSINNLEIKNKALDLIEKVKSINSKKQLQGDEIQILVRSKLVEDRKFAARALKKVIDDDISKTNFLLELLKDPLPDVRLEAIKTSAGFASKEVWTALANLLDSSIFSQAAEEALVRSGEETLETLEKFYNRSRLSANSLKKLISIYRKIGSERALQYLENKLNYPDKSVVYETLIALKECRYIANSKTENRFIEEIHSMAGTIAWKLAVSFGENLEVIGKRLSEAINYEIKQDFDKLFLLLSLTYDSQSIQLIKQNVESEIPEQIGFALELLDILLTEELKPVLIPLLEDISTKEKISRLELYFPIEVINKNTVITYIINKDYNYCNRWTKACAVYRLYEVETTGFENDIIANLFNEDLLLREVAALALNKMNWKLFRESSQRLSAQFKQSLQLFYDYQNDNLGNSILFNRVEFLNQLDSFRNLGYTILCEFAENMKLITEITMLSSHSKNNFSFYLVSEGFIQIKVGTETVKEFFKGDFFVLNQLAVFGINAVVENASGTELLYMKEEKYNELIGKYKKLENAILSRSYNSKNSPVNS